MEKIKNIYISAATAYRASSFDGLIAGLSGGFDCRVDGLSILLSDYSNDSAVMSLLGDMPNPLPGSRFVNGIIRLSYLVSEKILPALEESAVSRRLNVLTGYVRSQKSLLLPSALLATLSLLFLIAPFGDMLPVRFLTVFAYVFVLSHLVFFLLSRLPNTFEGSNDGLRGVKRPWTWFK